MLLYRSPRTSRLAFSVAEALIATAIIAVLLAILLPTVHTLRSRAMDSQCMSNLRVLGAAGLAYCNDRSGLLPDMGLYNSHRSSEAKYSLLPYLGYPTTGQRYLHPTPFTCPLSWKHAPTETSTYRTYAINRYATSSRINQPEDFEKIEPYARKRLQNIPEPSGMAFFMDGYHRGGGETATYYVDQNYGRLKPDLTPYLHRDAIHAVFMDGHIERITATYALAELTDRSSTTKPFWGHGN